MKGKRMGLAGVAAGVRVAVTTGTVMAALAASASAAVAVNGGATAAIGGAWSDPAAVIPNVSGRARRRSWSMPAATGYVADYWGSPRPAGRGYRV